MTVEREKNDTIKRERDQALNDATSGQRGEEPRSVPLDANKDTDTRNSRIIAARKLSREI